MTPRICAAPGCRRVSDSGTVCSYECRACLEDDWLDRLRDALEPHHAADPGFLRALTEDEWREVYAEGGVEGVAVALRELAACDERDVYDRERREDERGAA